MPFAGRLDELGDRIHRKPASGRRLLRTAGSALRTTERMLGR